MKKVTYMVMRRMPTDEEAADTAIVRLSRTSRRQKWRDISGRVWRGEPKRQSANGLSGWSPVVDDGRDFWSGCINFGGYSFSREIPGLLSEADATARINRAALLNQLSEEYKRDVSESVGALVDEAIKVAIEDIAVAAEIANKDGSIK